MQVRFADSPVLGLEDWPTRHKPDRIEQASEPVRIEHPVDSSTGRFLPARLRIKLVAPDFEIRGGSEQLIEVPPDEYSKRMAFLMTPRRTGFCRVNVEVYAADTLFLGAIAIESEVVQEGVLQAPLCIANLVLDVGVKDNDETQLPMARSLDNPPTAGSFGAPPPRGRASVREETVEPAAVHPTASTPSPSVPGAPVPAPSPRRMSLPGRQWAIALSAAVVLGAAALQMQDLARQQQSPPPTRPKSGRSHSAGHSGAVTADAGPLCDRAAGNGCGRRPGAATRDDG